MDETIRRTKEGNGFLWDPVQANMMRAGRAFKRACRQCARQLVPQNGAYVCSTCDVGDPTIVIPTEA